MVVASSTGNSFMTNAKYLMNQNPYSEWSSARASKTDVSRHVDVCRTTFRAQRIMCAYKSGEDNCVNVFSNFGNASSTDSSDNE